MAYRRTSAAFAATFLLLGLYALAASFAPPADADPITGVALQSMTTGTAPFDATSGPGQDATGTDDQVRSYDSVTYAWTVNVNSSTGTNEPFDRVDFTQTLPAGLSWQATDVPIYCQGPGWGISGQTLTCVYIPPGGTGNTGSTLNFTLTAQAGGQPDGTVATPAAGSSSATVSDGALTSAPNTATAPPVTIRSAPFLDMFKRQPGATVAPSSDPRGAGYYLSYPVGLQIPASRSTFGRRGSIMPNAPVAFTDDLSQISPNAVFDSCSGATISCTAGPGQTVDVAFTSLPADPNPNRSISSGTVRVFVPASDVSGSRNTTNTLTGLVANVPDGHGGVIPAPDADLTDNTADYNLITTGGTGTVGFGKHFLDANGVRLPTQAAINDGNGQVLDTQILQSELDIANNSATAPAPTPAVCDVWDNTRLHLSTTGPGPSAHGGAPVWAQTIPAGWVQGTDYVIEYGTQATATGADAARWTELQSRSACTDASDTWTTTLPADPSTVTKVRVQLLRDMAPGAASIAFRVNLAVDDGIDGDILANFLGGRVGTTWTPSTYSPTSPGNNTSGDRVRTNGVTVRVRKRSINPLVNFGSPASILSGNPVQFALTPTVTAMDVGTGAPVATDVVVRDRLPLGLTFDATQPTAPGSITPVLSSDAAGRQILTWTIPTMTQGSEPTLTFWARSSTTAIGDKLNEVIVDSAEDVGGLDAFPATAPPAGNQHYSTQTVRLQSAGGVKISKTALQSVVEPLDPLAFQIEYANLTGAGVTNVDIIDVLPFSGDGNAAGMVPGRTPPSARNGTLPIASIDVSNGETIRYTDAAPADIYPTSNPATTNDAAYGALPVGKTWCLATAFGTAGCPADLAAATAFRITRAALGSGQSGDVVLHLAPTGNRSGNVYSNTAAIRYGSGNLGALSNVATSRVVASTIGDYVWEDLNHDGIQDPGEPPLANVPITLTGTDKHGRSISVQTKTDANGKYLFTSSSQAGQDAGATDLVSGSYTVTFHRDGLPAGTTFTTQHSGSAGSDSDADGDGVATVTLPDPSPTGVDGQDLTVDAGIIRGVAAPPPPPASPTPPVDTTPPGGPGASSPSTDGPPPPTTTGGGDDGVPSTTAGKPKPSIVVHPGRSKVLAGQSVQYTIVVANAGDGAARNTVVCDTPGSGLALARVPHTARFSGGRLCWRLGTLKAGARRTLHVTMKTVAIRHRVRAANVAEVSATGVRSRRSTTRILLQPASAPSRHVGVTG